MLPAIKSIYKNFNESSIEKINVFKTDTAATVCDLIFQIKF